MVFFSNIFTFILYHMSLMTVKYKSIAFEFDAMIRMFFFAILSSLILMGIERAIDSQ